MKKAILAAGKDFTSVLPIFKELIIKAGIQEQDNLFFAGCPGPCYSMATFFGFGIRDLKISLYFAVNADINQLWKLEYNEKLGTIATKKQAPQRAKTLVLMSGLCTIPVEHSLEFIEKALVPDGIIIGEAPAFGFFEERSWDKKIPFNFLFEFSMANPTSFRISQKCNKTFKGQRGGLKR